MSEGSEERSRRQFLRGGGGALAGAGLLVAGCTSKVKQPSNIHITSGTPGARRDAEILNGLLRLEYRSIYTYTACIPLLPQPAPPPKSQHSQAPAPQPSSHRPTPPLELMVPLAFTAAQQFLTQELAHVSELMGFIRQTGGRVAKPAVRYELGHPGTKEEVLLLLHRTEDSLLRAYLHATPLLTPKALRGAAAAIFANHAQHSTVLRFQLGLTPIPGPFFSHPE